MSVQLSDQDKDGLGRHGSGQSKRSEHGSLDGEPDPRIQLWDKEKRFRLMLLIALTLSFTVWIVIGLYQKPKRSDTFINSYSTSPAGHSAFFQLLQEEGYEVSRSVDLFRKYRPLGLDHEAKKTSVQLLLEPRLEYIQETQERFEGTFSFDQNDLPKVVLSLPKYHYKNTEKTSEHGELLLLRKVLPQSEVQEIIKHLGLDEHLKVARRHEPSFLYSDMGSLEEDGQGVQFFTDQQVNQEVLQYFEVFGEAEELDDWSVCLWDDQDNPVGLVYYDQKFDRGPFVLVSEPEIFTNRVLAKSGVAELALRCIEQSGSKEVLIDESMHGLVDQASLSYLAATPPGLWLTLSVLFLLLLWGWRETRIFYPIQPKSPEPPSPLATIRGVGQLMLRARDEEKASKLLGGRIRSFLARHLTHSALSAEDQKVLDQGTLLAKAQKFQNVFSHTQKQRFRADTKEKDDLKK